MTTLILIIACMTTSFSTDSGPAEIAKQPKALVKETITPDKWETKQQMLESGMTQMDRYERFMVEPNMTFNPMRNA